jgi:hypothetical protein
MKEQFELVPFADVIAQAFEQRMCAKDIGLGKLEAIAERIIDVSLSCKMDDRVGCVCFENVCDQVGVADISVDERIVIERWFYVRGLSSIRQSVQVDEMRLFVFSLEVIENFASDRSASTRD